MDILAVGLRPVGPGPAVATLAEDRSIGVRAIRAPVVGQHPLDGDPLGGEDGESLSQGCRGSARWSAGSTDRPVRAIR